MLAVKKKFSLQVVSYNLGLKFTTKSTQQYYFGAKESVALDYQSRVFIAKWDDSEFESNFGVGNS